MEIMAVHLKQETRAVKTVLTSLLQQYQSAIRAHKAGKAVDFDELPVPPGENRILNITGLCPCYIQLHEIGFGLCVQLCSSRLFRFCTL